MRLKKFYCLIILFLSSCSISWDKTNEDALIGIWRLYNIEKFKEGTIADNSFSNEVKLRKIVQEGGLFCLFKNNSYSNIKGNGEYETGNWKYSQDTKSFVLINSGKVTDPIKVKVEKNSNGKEMLTLSIEKQKANIKFIKESEPLTDLTNEPFYATNNEWRIRPLSPETSTQLINRLANYFKHLALILKAAKERKATIVSFEFSQGPAKIYNGGIGIYTYNIVPDTWKKSFFNDADASTAYFKYEDYLKTSSYKGAGIGNWIEDDYDILVSIYADISNLKK